MPDRPPAVANPTDALNVDFGEFLAARQRHRAAHLIDGLPDYSFALDRELRSRITSIEPLRQLARMIVRSNEPMVQQLNLMNAVAVGPRQYPQVYRIAERCADTLGIGVPRVFVVPQPAVNAWTMASDDTRPSVMITAIMLVRFDEEELTAVIGHECGHIHNLHGAYNTLAEMLGNTVLRSLLAAALPGGSLLVPALSGTLRLFLLGWSRAAEITCDRAGAICAGGVTPMIRALARLTLPSDQLVPGFNADEYIRQLEGVADSPLRLGELLATHPLTQRRMAALKVFERSELLRGWLPHHDPGERPLDRAELDAACSRIVRVTQGSS